MSDHFRFRRGLENDDLAAAQLWLVAHKLDPNTTPRDALFGYDKTTDEYVVEQYGRRDGKFYTAPGSDGEPEVVRCFVRRKHVAELAASLCEVIE